MGTITKRSYLLADGRDIIYFDDADTVLAPERSPDLREPAPRPPTATMRQDVLTGEWISVASARQNRVVLPPSHLDPLSPASAGNPSEVPSMYDVAVFENKSPSFGPDLAGPDAPEGLEDLARIGLGRSRQSVGRCEVVCFSPEHTGSLAGVSLSRMRTVVEAWADRTAALSALPGVEQVFPFENRGEAIGVTLHHPHGQIYAYPFITPRTAQLIRSIQSYGSTLFEDVLRFEQTLRAGGAPGRALDRVRSLRRALAAGSPHPPAPARARPRRHLHGGTRRVFPPLPPSPAGRGRLVLDAHSLHFGLAPGTGACPPRRHPAHAPADVAPAGGNKTQIPCRFRGGDGCIHRRHPAGNSGRPAAGSHRGMTAAAAQR